MLIASVHVLHLYTTVNFLYSISHHFAMSGKDNNNKWEADNFSSLLAVFPITMHIQLEFSLSGTHTDISCSNTSFCTFPSHGMACMISFVQSSESSLGFPSFVGAS